MFSESQCSICHAQNIKGDWEQLLDDSRKNEFGKQSAEYHSMALRQVSPSQTLLLALLSVEQW
jgi:hypothetical protein